MGDNRNNLPEGTDAIIPGASTSSSGTDLSATGPTPDAATAGGPATGRLTDRVRTERDKLSGQAADKARGLVGQGLERSAEALANVGRLVGETAPGIEERLGQDYGDYARRAAGAIEDAANSLASKNPDELIDDTRAFIQRSPGVALAGAAIVGFALARLIKGGLARDDDKDSDRSSDA